MTATAEMNDVQIELALKEGLNTGEFDDSEAGFIKGYLARCKKSRDDPSKGPTEKQEAYARKLAEQALVGPLTDDSVAEASAHRPGRFQRVTAGLISAFRDLREGQEPHQRVASLLAQELGPTERLFLACAASLAIPREQQEVLVEAVHEEWHREDMRRLTEGSYRASIEIARGRKEEEKAQSLEAGLERLREKWAKEDAA